MATGIVQYRSARYMTVMRARLILAAVIIGVAGVLVGRGKLAVSAAAGALLLAAIVLVPVYYRALRYTRRGDGVVIERGIVVRRTQFVAKRQVEYITVRRTLLERMLGLCTLIFVTCAGKISLPGLCREDALRIRRSFEIRERG